MAVVSYLVDDAGRIWDTGSSQLRSELDAFGIQNFPDYVIKNLGFIRLEGRGKSATIWLRPETVSPAALDCVINWLSAEQIDRVLVNAYENKSWHHQILAPAHAGSYSALLYLRKDWPANSEPRSRVLARSIDAMRLPSDSPLVRALTMWRAAGGDWRNLARVSGFGAAVQHRYTLFEISGDRSFVLRGFGGGLPSYAKTWAEKTLNSCIYDHPDLGYIWSVVSSYREVVKNGQPELEEVDAVVSWPGAERQRRRYLRLLLPLSEEGCFIYLLSVTAEDSNINLRAVS